MSTAVDVSRFPPAVRERLKVAKANAERNANLAAAQLTAEQVQKVNERINRLVNSTEPVWSRLRQLYVLVAEVTASVAAHAACHRGCSHCCYTGVRIYAPEAKMLGSDIGSAPTEPKSRRLGNWAPNGYESPCPFLVKNECSIYEHRPFPCRIHYNMDVDSLLCELHAGVTIPVYYWNNVAFHMAYAMICGVKRNRPVPLADIREYFPTDKPECER
jgi:Fe-S-cluster containining protein